MEIEKLPIGKRAPIDSDCISIDQLPDGRFNLTGSILSDEESIAIVSPMICETSEAAEEQGIAWADSCNISTLYVATTLLSDTPEPGAND
jgi:hypothetical protein